MVGTSLRAFAHPTGTEPFEQSCITGKTARETDLVDGEKPGVERALDALNFFLADVRDGLGPYLAIYLLTEQKWDEASIGVVMSVAALAGIAAQTPAGALIDRSTAKRALMVDGGNPGHSFPASPCRWSTASELVAATQAIAAAAGAIFAPAIAAVTLGIVGPRAFARRTGRNEAFNHAGNAVAAAIAGVSAYSFGPIVVFWLLAAMAVASIVATLAIPAGAIDHHVARGLDDTADRDEPTPRQAIRLPGAADLQAVVDLCRRDGRVSLLERGDAAAGRAEAGARQPRPRHHADVGLHHRRPDGDGACGDAGRAQGRRLGTQADLRGGARRPGAARRALSALRQSLLAGVVQLLDGVGAGIFGALFPLVVADLTRGTGHFNVSQGAIATAAGLGGALSTAAAGLIVVKAGYSAAFLFLAAVAGAGLIGFATMMPETLRRVQNE